MPLQNRNAAWVHAILDELARAGVRQAVISPGGRSVAIVDGIASIGWEIAHVQTDERAAAFFALGLAKATGRPVAIAVTSGSAVANLLPALVEADSSDIPLIVLSADRPRGGRRLGMPQTTDQLGLCAAVVRAALDLGNPSDDSAALESLRGEVSDLLPHLIGARRGPVQINLPLEGKMTSADATPGWLPPPLSELARHGRRGSDGSPLPMRGGPDAAKPHRDWDGVRQRLGLRAGMRGIIFAAVDCPLAPAAAAELSYQLGFPLLADAASGLRRPDMPNLVTSGDLQALISGKNQQTPELLIRLGGAPVGHFMQAWLGTFAEVPVLRLDRKRIEADYLTPAFELIEQPDLADLQRLAEWLGKGDPVWLQQWLRRDALVDQALRSCAQELPWGECQAAAIILNEQAYDFLHVANSMSARHANTMLPARHQDVYCNRGANGIDGTLSTFLGTLCGTGSRGMLLVGDQTFLHDLTGLEAVRLPHLRGTICVSNNRGASLFDMLELDDIADYAKLIRNPPGYDIGHAAATFGMRHFRCDSAEVLRQALRQAREADGVTVIETVVPADSLRRDVLSLYGAALAALQEPAASSSSELAAAGD